MAVDTVMTVVSAAADRRIPTSSLASAWVICATIGRQEHLHAETIGLEVLAIAALLHPLDDGADVLHRFVEQLVLRPHRGPHHVAERRHVLAALHRQAEQVGQHLVDERPRDRRDRIDRRRRCVASPRAASASASALKAAAISARAFGERALAITGRTAV